MTGLGPLITTLIPPPSCTSSFADVYITTDPGGAGVFGGSVSTDGCFPSNYQDIRSTIIHLEFAQVDILRPAGP